MSAISDEYFGVRLCEILKLDPKRTRDIVIKNMINSAVIIEVTQYLQMEDSQELLLELKKYELTEKKDESTSSNG